LRVFAPLLGTAVTYYHRELQVQLIHYEKTLCHPLGHYSTL
jgi:hypothetical protein